jgi:hypothetical protein
VIDKHRSSLRQVDVLDIRTAENNDIKFDRVELAKDRLDVASRPTIAWADVV